MPTTTIWTALEILARRRGMIFGVTLVATIGAVILAFALPKWYRAEALLLPPKETTVSIDQLSRLAEVVSVTGGLDLPVMVTPSDVYARIFRSRSVYDSLIDQFNLKERYETATMTETYEAVEAHAKAEVTSEGLLSITVVDKDPQIASDMANAFVNQLNHVGQEIIALRARRTREFIENRLAQVKSGLDTARNQLRIFQETNRTVDFNEQTRLAIDQATALKVQLAEIDLDVQLSEQRYGKNNPDLMELRERRSIVQKQIQSLETGSADSSYFSLPMASIPGLRGKYELLFSAVRIQDRLYSALLEQLEQARLQEKQETPVLSVLDWARPPELKYKPFRALIVGATFALAFFFSAILALFLEYLVRLENTNPDEYRRVAYVINATVGWLPGVRRKATVKDVDRRDGPYVTR